MGCPFTLIVTDVDGCVGPGEAVPYDLRVLGTLGKLNRRARRGDSVPAVTLCTGRSAAYVDAMMQTIEGFLPAIFENGAGLYFPQNYSFAWNPSIPASARRTMLCVRELVERDVVQSGIGYVQPGKEMALTLFPMPGYTLDQVGTASLKALEGHGLLCTVEVSVTSVGIWLNGVNKGEGVKWLAQETETPLECMVGVGDAPGDNCFLELVGFPAAPANAEPEVKACVQYVSPHENGQGLLDIIDRVLAGNSP
jgi:hydroxymethylpyrimidine pyrophosphatase-like HAD family hydrolase